MRTSAALIAVPLLLGASACKSTDPDGDTASPTATATTGGSGRSTTTGSGGTGGSTVAPIVDDRAPGVTDDSITIGITFPDFAALGSAVNINHGDYEAAYTAVIDDINSRGGVHGRTLEPVFAPVNPADATSTDATCTMLTQDDPVFVALGLFFGDAVNCYVSVNDTAVIGGEMTDERLAQANAPWFAYDLSSDAQADGIQALVENGDLTGSIAVLLTDTDQPVFEDRITPILEDARIDVLETGILTSGLDAEQSANEARTIFQRFRSSAVQTVLALGQGTANAVADGLGGTDYRPQLLFNSTNGVNAFAKDPTRDPSVFEGAVGVGVYGPPDAFLDLEGSTRDCFDVIRAAGITLNPPSQVAPGDPNSVVSALAACQQLTLLTAILDGAGENLNYGTFETAGDNLGEILLPGEPEPFFYGPAPHNDGDRPLYRFEFDIAARQFAQAFDD